jgi:alpha-glucosidase (family GH31 glycosyl hydrolase)
LLLAAGKSVYLPQGNWTNLKSNALLKGRQVVQIEEIPAVFARNGSIVPMNGSGTLELHYFPKLGGEFFIFEEEVQDYTQVHAAPAADVMRLQIESKVARDYTWVVHHVAPVKSVVSMGAQMNEVTTVDQLRDRTWHYDSSLQNLYVRDRAYPGQDHIINLSF